MDMTDLKRAPSMAHPMLETNTPTARESSGGAPWTDVVSALSAEMAVPLTQALQRVEAMTNSGRIDRAGLQALNQELQEARRLSVAGQQLARLAAGQVRQVTERVPLEDTVKQVLAEHTPALEARGVQVKQFVRPVEVIVDAALLFNLVDTLARWSAGLAQSDIEFRIDVKTWPALARLGCRFAIAGPSLPPDHPAATPADNPLNTLTWRLVEQTARSMGLIVEHQLQKGEMQVRFEFPRTVGKDQLEGMSAFELDDPFAPAVSAKPLAGSQVLVVASRREVRLQVRDAIRNMGLVVDFAGSIDEAREFCMGGLPHAIVIESVLRGARFNNFRQEIKVSEPSVVFIELIEEGSVFEISGFGGLDMARVGRDAIGSSLPSALMFELAKTA
jgi:hypothetical protein